jgi:recombination protein RecT
MANQTKELSIYLNSQEVKNKFIDLVGNKPTAEFFISNALVAVANSEALQKCTKESIFTSVFRAASLRLSCDPAAKQAALVPLRNKKKGGVMECNLWPMYKGYYDMAIRTGYYKRIDVVKIYQGMEVVEDYLTGKFKIEGAKESSEVIGWLGLFEMSEKKFNSMFKYLYMSVEEIHEHGKQWSQTYSRDDSPWKTSPGDMEKKTVLKKLLSHWGYFDFADVVALQQLEAESLAPMDVELVEIPAQVEEVGYRAMAELGFEDAPSDPEAIRAGLIDHIRKYEGKEASADFRGFIASVLGSIFKTKKERYAVTEYITGVASIKDVPGPMVFVLRDWLMIDDDNQPHKNAKAEAQLILRQALKDQGQLEMEVE